MLLWPLATIAHQTQHQREDHYIYDREDYNLLCTWLEHVEADRDGILEECSLDDMWCLIQGRIKDSMDIAIAKRLSHTTSRPRPMWMDADTFNKVTGKHRAWNRDKHTGTSEDHILYVRASYQSRWLTRNAVRTFERSLASMVCPNPKVFWRYAWSKTTEPIY